jgi:hypothetical protein
MTALTATTMTALRFVRLLGALTLHALEGVLFTLLFFVQPNRFRKFKAEVSA